MEVWQIIFPVCILRLTRQNPIRPHLILVSYFPPPFKKDGPEAQRDVAGFFAVAEPGKAVHGFVLVILDEIILYVFFFIRLVSYIVLVEEYAPGRNPEAGLQVIHRRMQVVSPGVKECPRHELGRTL